MAALAIGGALAAGAIYNQRKQQKEIEKAQEKQIKAEQRKQDVGAARERRRQIAQRQVLQAQIENQAAVAGQSGSSGAIVGQVGVGQQTGQNLSGISTDIDVGNSIFAAQRGVANAGRQSIAESLVTTAGNSFIQAGASAGASSIFKQSGTPSK